MFLGRIIHFGKKLGDQVKSPSPIKLKSVIEVAYVAHMKVQVLSLNVILISSLLRVPSPSYPFLGGGNWEIR